MPKFVARCSRFFARQFEGTAPTPAQRGFDVVFGIIGPIFCLAFDPFVFRPGLLSEPMFDGFVGAVFGCGGLAMCAFIAWMVLPIASARRTVGFLAGLMFAGALLATVIGLALLPFSVIGLMVVIGMLGFTPFVSAFVYSRTAVRACRASRSTPFVLAGAALALLGPTLIQVHVNRAVERALTDLASPDAPCAAAGAEVLHRYRGLVSYAAARNASAAFGDDSAAREEFARRFQAATGRPLVIEFD